MLNNGVDLRILSEDEEEKSRVIKIIYTYTRTYTKLKVNSYILP